MRQKTAGRWCFMACSHNHMKPPACIPVGSSVFTQMWHQPCCNLQHLCSVLELSAAIQPSTKPRVLCWKLGGKILCILITPAFIFFNIMGFSCPHKPSSLGGWGLADIKFGRKLCIPVSAILHHIPAYPSHCTSTSNHFGF